MSDNRPVLEVVGSATDGHIFIRFRTPTSKAYTELSLEDARQLRDDLTVAIDNAASARARIASFAPR